MIPELQRIPRSRSCQRLATSGNTSDGIVMHNSRRFDELMGYHIALDSLGQFSGTSSLLSSPHLQFRLLSPPPLVFPSHTHMQWTSGLFAQDVCTSTLSLPLFIINFRLQGCISLDDFQTWYLKVVKSRRGRVKEESEVHVRSVVGEDEDDGTIEAGFDLSSQGGLLGIVLLLIFLFPPYVDKYSNLNFSRVIVNTPSIPP